MHGEPLIPVFVLIMLGILATAIVIKKLKQPYVIAYLLAGIVLGKYGFDVIHDTHSLSRLGEVGVILLLFFAGMEISPRKFAENWKVPTIGTLLQIVLTISLTVILGEIFGWSFAKMFLYGSAICLSSTAVVLKLLEDSNETRSRQGQNILGVLLVQDLAVVPMLIIIGLLGGSTPSSTEIIIQIIGGIFIIVLAAWLAIKETIKIPLISMLGKDKDMRVFTSLIICFGMSSFTGALGLSSALGAFIGGMIVATAKETEWVAHSLQPVKTVFMALFFVSIGMLIDLGLIWHHLWLFMGLLLSIYIVNTFINAFIFRTLKEKWSESICAGATLSQIGEFSFVLISMAFSLSIINTEIYEFWISLISLSLLFSPLWISTVRKLVNKYIND